MKTPNLNIIALSVLLTFSAGNAMAKKDAAEKGDLQDQAKEYQVSDGLTLSTDALVQQSSKQGRLRDKYREDENINILKVNSLKAAIDSLDSEIELERKKFISKNVPAYVLAAGDKAVASYVAEHLSDSLKPKLGRVETVWVSTTDTLHVPNSAGAWSPTIAPVPAVHKTVEPAVEVVEVTPVDQGDENTPSDDQALAQLGLTAEDLKAMLGGTEPEPAEATSIEPPQEHVTINKIEVARSVIMGKSVHANVKLSMNVSRAGQNRKVVKSFNKVGPGYMFQVEGVRFELLSLDRDYIVFENLETRQTYRESTD